MPLTWGYTSDVPRSEFAGYHREAVSKLQSSVAAATAQLADLLERAQAASVFETHPELVDLDRELDNHYPNGED